MSFCIGLNQHLTYLPQLLDLTGYEVSAVECYLPNHILSSGHNFEVMVSTDSGMSYAKHVNVQLPANSPWAVKILHKLVDQLADFIEAEISPDGHISIKTVSDDIVVKLPPSLTSIFGLSDHVVTSTVQQGDSVISFDILLQRVVLTCNVVQPFQFHGRYIPCVYMGSPNPTSYYPVYRKTTPGSCYSIALDFYNTFLEKLAIPDRTFSLLLHFKKA